MLETIIGKSWADKIGKEFDKPYMDKLSDFVSKERDFKVVYPEREDVFKALQLTPFNEVKVVILGQDPYYDGYADGLAFSYKGGLEPPNTDKSLNVIFREIERDCYNGFNINYNYSLDYLAKQGVLLLNSVLTVVRGKPNSHAGKGWETLTQAILFELLKDTTPKVFMLWGQNAKKLFGNTLYNYDIITHNHLVLNSPHPAADLYNRDNIGAIKIDYPNTFSGCGHFSQANKYLSENRPLFTLINWFDIEEPYFNVDIAEKEFLNEKGYPKSWDL